MKRKIFGSMCIIAFLSILITSLSVIAVFYGDFYDKMKNEIAAETGYIKIAIDKQGTEFLDQIVKIPEVDNRNRITLIDSDGTVLFDNYYNPDALVNHLEREEVQSALKLGVGRSSRISDTLQTQTYYYAVRLENGMVLRLANTDSSVFASVISVLPLVLLICAGVFLIIIWIATKETKRIVRPINEIDLEDPSKNIAYDELAPFLEKFEKQNKTIRLQMEELKVKQREFTALTENMSEGFLVVDKDAKVLSYNTSALELLGNYEAIQEKQNILTFNRSMGLQKVVETALGGKPSEQEFQIEGRYCQVIANPVISRNQITGVVVVIWDITERQQREQMRREFSANVSHELKTPLTSISGYAEIIKNGMVKPDDIPRFAEHIYNETGRLISMVGDIIKLSQLDERQVELAREEVDLLDLSNEVIERLRPNAAKRDITLTASGEHVKVDGVKQILDEMLYNLCINAITYNKDQGCVKVSAQKENNRIILSVEDNGIGIPEVDQQRVFERFYRVDKSHSKQLGGTGLGLSIVKHGALYHGATIEMQSKENQGTTICIIWDV